MKILALFIATFSLLLISCQEPNPSELRIKSKFCMLMIHENDKIFGSMISEVSKSQNPTYKTLLTDSKKITTWRDHYLQKKTRENLLVYCDSIVNRFRKSSYSDTTVIEEIEINKQNIKSADTLSILNLLYWTLTAEQSLLEQNAWRLGSSMPFYTFVESFTNGKYFSLKDTVFISVNSISTRLDYCDLDFSSITCRNTTTNSIVTPKVIKTGPIYIVRYLPREVGHYIVEGKVKITEYPDFESELMMHNDFQVK